MIIVFGGIKGGTGKTTLATNIAVCASNDKKKVLLIDSDEQRSASDWASQRESSSKSINVTTISMIGNRIHTQILTGTKKRARISTNSLLEKGPECPRTSIRQGPSERHRPCGARGARSPCRRSCLEYRW